MSGEFFWKAKLVQGGPFIGVRTWFGPPLVDGEVLERSSRWQAQVRLETTGRAILMGDNVPIEVDGIFLRGIEQIKEAEYRFLIAHAAHATQYAPHMADAAPTTAVDWLTNRTVF